MPRRPHSPTRQRLPLVLGALAALPALGACDDDGTAATAEPAARSYLVADGTWLLDDREQSFADARNPKRLELETSEVPGSVSVFSFFADAAGDVPIAAGCVYQYNRSQPDSHRFPASKEAVWLFFELQPESPAACAPFRRVGFAPTLSGDTRLHVRYGDVDYAELVGPTFSDPASPDLWWSVYRPVGEAREAPLFPYEVANGERVMDPTSPATTSDTRNPSRVSMTTSAEAGSESRFVFGADLGLYKLFDIGPHGVGFGVRGGVDWISQTFETSGTAPDRDQVAGRVGPVVRTELALGSSLALTLDLGAEAWIVEEADGDGQSSMRAEVVPFVGLGLGILLP